MNLIRFAIGRALCTFFFCIIFLSLKCYSNVVGKTSKVGVRATEGFSIKNSLINYVLNRMDRKNPSWIDLEKVNMYFGEVDIDVKENIVECKSGPYVVPVNILDKQVVFANEMIISYHIGVSFPNIQSIGDGVRYMPLTLNKNVNDAYSNQIDLLPVGFKGYLVCLAEGEEAMLVPNQIEQVHFAPPPWNVRIKLQLVKNPLAKFGRVFRITILDNIKVLSGTSKQFDLTLEEHNLVLAFYLSLAIEKQNNGKFCILSRNEGNKKVMIDCESWKLNASDTMKNALLTSFLTATIFKMIYKRKLFAEPLKIVSVQKRSKDVKFENYLIEDSYDNIFNEVEAGDDYMLRKQRAFGKNLKKKLRFTGASIILLYFLKKIIFFNTYLLRGIKVMKDQFEKAPFAYQWSLSKQYDFSLHWNALAYAN